jgi:uncharacterized protein (TIGR03083 family)
MDAIEAIEVSQVEFERRLCAVRDDQWSLPTPCEKWTVRELVSHVVAGARTYLALLDGCSREEAAAILYGSELGGDPSRTSGEPQGRFLKRFVDRRCSSACTRTRIWM